MKSISLILASSAIGLAASAAWISMGSSFERPGLVLHDFLQRAFPAKSSGQVALILLDQSSVEALAKNDQIYFPFPRALYAEFIDAAKVIGAKAVGFDVIFSEPSAKGPEDDQAFADAISGAGVPVVFVGKTGSSEPTDILRGAKNVSWGHTLTAPPVDGIFRRLDLNGDSFTAKLAPSGEHTGWIHFSAPHVIAEVPFYNVLQAKTNSTLLQKLQNELRGKIWIFAYGAPGLLDVKPTPIDPFSPGAYLPAHLIAEKLSGLRGISQTAPWGYCGLVSILFLIWCAIIIVVSPEKPQSLLIILSMFSVVGPLGATLSLWVFKNVWLDPVVVTFGLICGTGFHFTYKVRRDWADRRRFARAIEHSMSPQMLKLIEQGDVEVRRFGEKREVFVLFADLSGFTTMSEQLTPEMLVKLMNDYLDDAVDLIIDRSGYVDKFIGDAVMALWGAPVKAKSLQIDANAALAAALGFKNVTDRCQQRWKKNFGVEIPVATRVGVHFGEAVVGNLGSHERFNYTALGDTVNLASRLEGVGKYYDQLITVSDDVIGLASPDIAEKFFLVDEVIVKGKDRPTRIYTAIGTLEASDLVTYQKAFAYYSQQEWTAAIDQFSLAEKAGIGAAKTLLKRCEGLKLGDRRHRFENGVWRLDEK